MSVQNDQTHTHSAGHSEMHGNTSAASKRVTDPVCGMKVDPATAISHQHAGMTHYFCSEHCREKFRADPDRYLTAKPAMREAVPPIGNKIQYTCPMHPEIVRDAPGDCPICGMALVPIAGTGQADDSELRDLARRLWVGVALSIPLVVLAMSPMIGIHDLLGTPVVLWVGWPILRKFWLSIAHGALNIYTLIGLGVGLAYAFSLAAVLKGDLRGIARAAVLSRATMRNIRRNLVFAFGYNALGIPVAAGVLYPAFGLLLSPIYAGAAMALSSVSVVSNALRLNRIEL